MCMVPEGSRRHQSPRSVGGARHPGPWKMPESGKKPWLDRPELDPAWTRVTGRSGPGGNGGAGRAQDHAPVAEADICVRVGGKGELKRLDEMGPELPNV